MAADQATSVPDHTPEVWAAVPGYEGFYEVSTHGRVRSLPRKIVRKDGRPLRVPGLMMKPSPDIAGYLRVNLQRCGEIELVRVHTMVMLAFVGPPPAGAVVNHLNADKTDNRPGNLEYCTSGENTEHACRMGLMPKGEAVGSAKLDPDRVRQIRELLAAGVFQDVIAFRFGIAQGTVSDIATRKTWGHV